MSATTTALLVAALSAVVSLSSAVWVEISRRRSSEQLANKHDENMAVLEKFKDDLARSRDADTKTAEARQLVGRYRDPLLLSAFDLQSRIYNVLRSGGFTGRRHPDYFRFNTLFVIAEFFGWVEILRRDMQFLDLGTAHDTKQLSIQLEQIKAEFASTENYKDAYYIYRGEQRAMGELMVSRLETSDKNGLRHECMGYASFVAKQNDPVFAGWFERLGTGLTDLPGKQSDRLTAIQNALIDLIDFLDPEKERFVGRRGRLVRQGLAAS